jgi:hypothetical protein
MISIRFNKDCFHAASIQVVGCTDGQFHILLLDDDGEVAAIASFNPEKFERLLRDGIHLMSEMPRGGLAAMPIGGQA